MNYTLSLTIGSCVEVLMVKHIGEIGQIKWSNYLEEYKHHLNKNAQSMARLRKSSSVQTKI